MTKRISTYLRASSLALTVGASLTPTPARSAPPQRPVVLPYEKPAAAKPSAEKPPVVAPADPASDVPDDPWEERKARAREDVDYLETYLKAKQAECREAEMRVTTFLAYKYDLTKQKQKGLTTPFQVNINEVNLAENQTQLEMRRVEQKDVEIRLARARRRLKAVERSGSIPEAESMPNDDRIRELEIKVERLRNELERATRFTETTRHN